MSNQVKVSMYKLFKPLIARYALRSDTFLHPELQLVFSILLDVKKMYYKKVV